MTEFYGIYIYPLHPIALVSASWSFANLANNILCRLELWKVVWRKTWKRFFRTVCSHFARVNMLHPNACCVHVGRAWVFTKLRQISQLLLGAGCKVAVRHTYVHHLAKSDIAVSMDVDQASGQECKKRKTENNKWSLAITLRNCNTKPQPFDNKQVQTIIRTVLCVLRKCHSCTIPPYVCAIPT